MIKTTRKFKFNKRRIRGLANVLFFRRHSNLFLVFLDLRWKHIITLTSGSCKLGKTKKQKVSALNIDGLVKKLKTHLVKYNISSIRLILRQRIPYFFYKLKKMFKLNNIRILYFKFILCKRHGIKRGRKLRRI